MALLPNFEQVAKEFVQHYYALFDSPEQRVNLVNAYSTNSMLTFEGVQILGRERIAEKLASLTFQRINHQVTLVDSQPTLDGGVIVYVMGQLKTDDDPVHTFSQVFILQAEPNGGFSVRHDIFRLALHS